MEICTKFNLMDRAWTWGRNDESITFIHEVLIEGINVDVKVDDKGNEVPITSYLTRKRIGGDDIWLAESELFLDDSDLITHVSLLFDNRKLTFPKVVPFGGDEIDKVA
jgi:hypothetical protein